MSATVPEAEFLELLENFHDSQRENRRLRDIIEARGLTYRLRVAYHRRLFAIGEWWWLRRHGPLPTVCGCGAVYIGECSCSATDEGGNE